MVSTRDKIIGILRLIRLHSILASVLAPILGACGTFAVKGYLSTDDLPVLFFLGLVGGSVHIFGQVLNDYADYDIDRQNPELKDKPLVSGAVTRGQAKLIIAISFIAIFIAGIPIYNSVWSVICIILMVGMAVAYDTTSKKLVHSAFFLALWAFFLGLFGGLTAGDYNLSTLPPLVWIICLLGAMQMYINTAILGHLKDIKNDSECGAVTFPRLLGVRAKKNDELIIPGHFWVLVMTIQFLNLAIAFIPIVLMDDLYPGEVRFIFLAMALTILSIIILGSMSFILSAKRFERGKLMRMMAIREISAYFLVIILIYPMVGAGAAALFIMAPLVWFLIVNKLLTKSSLQPAI